MNPTEKIAKGVNDEYFDNDVVGGGVPTETEVEAVAKTAAELGESLTTLIGQWETVMEGEYTTRLAARKSRYDELYGSQRTGNDNNTIAALMDKEQRVVADEVKALRLAHFQENSEDVNIRILRLANAEKRLSVFAKALPSPLAMLAVSSLSDPRRATLHANLASAGALALTSYAKIALATDDRALAAAVCARISELPESQRPEFTSNALAAKLVGPAHAKIMGAYKAVKSHFQGSRNRVENFKSGKKPTSMEHVRSGLASHANAKQADLGTHVKQEASR